jgi:hypothetical protein
MKLNILVIFISQFVIQIKKFIEIVVRYDITIEIFISCIMIVFAFV